MDVILIRGISVRMQIGAAETVVALLPPGKPRKAAE
jgi:hypothetical protein